MWYCEPMSRWPNVQELPQLHIRMIRACFEDGLGTLHGLSEVEGERPDGVKKAVRDMLRIGGFKPSGRNKPASEYLLKASESGKIARINPVVDAHNQASLISGLPISVVDASRLSGALSVRNGEPDASYVFNPAGQVIQVAGLPCLHDELGPCANAVKDAQRTKTDDGTTETLTIIWGVSALAAHTDRLAVTLRDTLAAAGQVVGSW